MPSPLMILLRSMRDRRAVKRSGGSAVFNGKSSACGLLRAGTWRDLDGHGLGLVAFLAGRQSRLADKKSCRMAIDDLMLYFIHK